MSGTLIAWPDFAIPFQPLNDPLAITPPDDLEVSDFEQGEPRQLRIFRNAPTIFDLQWAFTVPQMTIWTGFREAVKGGCFKVPVFAYSDYVTVTAMFVNKSIKEQRSGYEWLVSAQVMTMDKLTPSETDYVAALLLWGYGGSLDDFMSAFHTMVQSGWYGALV